MKDHDTLLRLRRGRSRPHRRVRPRRRTAVPEQPHAQHDRRDDDDRNGEQTTLHERELHVAKSGDRTVTTSWSLLG